MLDGGNFGQASLATWRSSDVVVKMLRNQVSLCCNPGSRSPPAQLSLFRVLCARLSGAERRGVSGVHARSRDVRARKCFAVFATLLRCLSDSCVGALCGAVRTASERGHLRRRVHGPTEARNGEHLDAVGGLRSLTVRVCLTQIYEYMPRGSVHAALVAKKLFSVRRRALLAASTFRL